MGRVDAESMYDYESVAHLLDERLDGRVSLEEIEAETDVLLGREWGSVERIARALPRRQRLSAGDVLALLAAEPGPRRARLGLT